jgi:hypothetical protein
LTYKKAALTEVQKKKTVRGLISNHPFPLKTCRLFMRKMKKKETSRQAGGFRLTGQD